VKAIATGYMFFENLYFSNNTFMLIGSDGSQALDAERWIKCWPGFSDREYTVSVLRDGAEACAFCQSNLFFRNIVCAIMITDFLPKYETHLYHMLENLLGIWATMDELLPQGLERDSWPQFLILPQNKQHEFGGATLSLIRSVFPHIRMIDSDRFYQLSDSRTALRLQRVIASDRSGCDHWGSQ
jgi:hypothetical protein